MLVLGSTSMGLVALATEPNVCSIDLEVVTDSTIRQTALQDGLDNATCDIIELSGSDTVSLNSALTVDSSQIVGTSARDVTIRAAEGSVVTMDATRSNDLIDVLQATDTLRLDGIAVTGASSGAIFASGDVFVSNSRFEGNSNPSEGGALHVLGDLDLAGTNYFVNNASTGYGGAIMVEGTGGVTGTSIGIFESNNAGGGGGSVASPFGPVSFASLTVSDSISDLAGGGIYASSLSVSGHVAGDRVTSVASSGGLFYTIGDVSLGSLTVTNFLADGGGGAIFSNGDLTINGAFSASSGSSVSGSGGALFSVGNMSLGSADVSSITADRDGGAIYSVGTLTISGALSSTSTSAVTGDGGSVAAVNKVTIGSVDVSSSIAGGDGSVTSVSNVVEIEGDATFRESTALGSGGGISAVSSVLIRGDLTANNMSATSNGGVINSHSSSVTVEGATNISSVNAGGSGGAIRAVGNVSIAGGTFENIIATGDGGCIRTESMTVTSSADVTMTNCISQTGNGGAISSIGDVTLTGGTFSGNTASSEGGAISSMNGGVSISGEVDIANSVAQGAGGAIYAINDVTLGGGTLSNNTSDTRFGGAIYSANGSVESTAHIVLSGNTAPAGGGGAVVAIGDISMTSADISQNTSLLSGGALLSVNGAVSFSGDLQATNNYSQFYGGAISATTSVELTTATFTGNTADISGGAISSRNGTVTATGETRFENNSATYGDAGAIEAGGGLTLAKATFKNNSAAFNGGAAMVNFGNVSFTGDALFQGNYVVNGFGGALSTSENLSATNLTIKNSLGYIGGGAYVAGAVSVPGTLILDSNISTAGPGGLFAFGDVTLGHLEATDNQSDFAGGAIQTYGTLSVSGESLLERNTSAQEGGAISALRVDIAKGTFVDNSSGAAGGAIYATASVGIGSGSLFDGNSSAASGGAIYADEVTVRGTAFENNQSVGFGGAVYGSSSAQIFSSSFRRNSTDNYGGAAYAGLNLISMNSSYVENTAAGVATGGGALASDGLVEAGFNTFLDNEADFGTQIYTADLGLVGNIVSSDGDGQITASGDLFDLGGNLISGELFYDFSDSSKLGLGTSIGLEDPALDEVSGFYFAKLLSSSPARAAVTNEMISEVQDSTALTSEFKALFAGESPEYAADLIGNDRIGTFDAGALQYQAPAPATAAPYLGPVIIVPSDLESLTPGQIVQFEGSNLESVTEITIGGKDAKVSVISDSLLELTVPEIEAGDYNLMVTSSFGQLSVFPEVRVGPVAVQNAELVIIVKRISETDAKIWAKNIVGAGKVQFMANGEEFAWIRTVDETNPRLRFANSSYYFVRTVKLEPGKNTLEIYVDGQRVRRVAYTG